MSAVKAERYAAYKDSEIDWLWADIPQTWNVGRIKDLAFLQSGNGIISEQIDTEGNFPVYGGNGLRGFYSDYTNDGSYILIGRQGALCGNINYASGKFWASEHAVVVYLKRSVNMKWFGELLRVMNLNQYSLAAAQPGLAMDRIKRLMIPVPPLHEQTAIAAYLDIKTAQIDRQIDLLSQKATQYGKLKRSLINETVTRGLDKSVVMKDSGVEWIGEVPAHWDVRRINDIAIQNKTKNSNVVETNLLSLSYGRIIRKDFNTSFGLLPESFETYQVVNEGTVILRLTDLQNDQRSLRVGLASERGIITSAYLGLVFNRSINSSFAYYLLHVYDLAKVFYWFGGGLRSTMRFDDIKVIPFVIPPVDEQKAITKYLDEKNAQIDRIVTAINTQIAKLKDLRKALINDVVTGKIKVVSGGAAA
jgi:type I restriction enzyme, S subunit